MIFAYQRPVEETVAGVLLSLSLRLGKGTVHVQVAAIQAHCLGGGGLGDGGEGGGRGPLVRIVNPVLVRVGVGRGTHGGADQSVGTEYPRYHPQSENESNAGGYNHVGVHDDLASPRKADPQKSAVCCWLST